MKKTCRIKEVEFITTKDEIAYQEVVDDFRNAKRITVVTFNISKEGNRLMNSLKDCNNSTKITIISNIPQRWEKYTVSNAKIRARQNIRVYKNKLDPRRISEKTEVYFCFSNHSKIIMTNNIVYVGSANYSEESRGNFESGFISRDKEFISFLENDVFPWIVQNSMVYNTEEYLLYLKAALEKKVSVFCEIYDRWIECFYIPNDHFGSEDDFYYNTSDKLLSVEDVERVQETMSRYIELLEEVNEIYRHESMQNKGIEDITNYISEAKESIRYINQLFEDGIMEYAEFDHQEMVDKYISKHSLKAYDKYVGKCMDDAMDDANEYFEDLAYQIKESADHVLDHITALYYNAEHVLNSYSQLPKEGFIIDNTK